MLEQYQPICPICKRTFAKLPEKVSNKPNNPLLVNNNSVDAATRETTISSQNASELVNNSEYSVEMAKFGRCPDCESPFQGLWAFGWRTGTLEKLVEEYKYQSLRAAGPVLTELLDAILPENLGQERPVVVVPLPTIGRHIRERGLDHTWQIAKRLARQRGWECQKILARAADTVQVGAKVSARKAQAEKAYVLEGKPDPDKAYLLLDDVWTTGSTMLSAAKILQQAGLTAIYGAVLAVSRQKS